MSFKNTADGSRASRTGSSGKNKNEKRYGSSGGKWKLQSYTLRYALGAMEKQAHEIHKKAKDPVQQKRLEQLTAETIGRVRQRLNEQRSLPSKYQKAEDPCVDNLEQLNRQRQGEIKSNQKLLAALQKQVKENEKEIQRMTKEKRARKKKLDNLLLQAQEEDSSDHGQQVDDDLLPEDNPEETWSNQHQVPRSLQEASDSSSYRLAPKGTMVKFLDALKSCSQD
ncbi:expressed unknown protein [Seminavis robusta]|uniref:Uncharacterized protein n=1 Tax=Seminavis robusta TaxID=568900 RepID=A0A9N8DYF7_9STRA|nr:expressed unknown protein [Seminavis robusta]|eukprot:Sro376_g129890.1 n/a (224) ;mRNA; r:68675-69548